MITKDEIDSKIIYSVYNIGNEKNGFIKIEIKKINHLIIDTLKNMNKKNEYYNYFKSVLEYNIKSADIDLFISPELYSDDLDYFKYKYEYDKYFYMKDKSKYNEKIMKTLNEVNNYIWSCFEVSHKFKSTYCIKCDKEINKKSWNRHLQTKYHNKKSKCIIVK